ncbi:MAG: DUF308 domain-containing protein [Lachnospiraceae bacterium]|nr:DUF308 domain-containing protein [Lachnospiraceae bacterium]
MEEKKSVVFRSILVGILLIVLGILAIIFRSPILAAVATILKWVVGGILITTGIFMIVAFVRDKSKVYSLIIGILAIIAGILMFIFNLVILLAAVFIGISFLLNGGLKVREAIAASKVKAKSWFVSLIIGIIDLILGVLVLIYPFAAGVAIGEVAIIITGVGFIVTGILDITHGLLISKS